MKILVTGGAGYIGSHTVVELIASGHEAVIVDNLSNSDHKVLARLEKIVGQPVEFHPVDLCNKVGLQKIFAKHHFDAVIHFAGYKSVDESVEEPLRYYANNIGSTVTLCEVMARHDVRQIVFSSSAAVYGEPARLPITEDAAVGAISPYGHTKLMIEQILKDVAVSEPKWQVTILRYFNPVGAHHSGLIGEDPKGTPNNLVPFIAQVATGRRKQLKVYGNDYQSKDGTGVRDFLHVVDLAKGHVNALEHAPKPGEVALYNLGTGRGNTVLEVVAAFEKAAGRQIPYEIVSRRPGDISACYADPKRAEQHLGWRAEKTLDDMCADTFRWQTNNPYGYSSPETS